MRHSVRWNLLLSSLAVSLAAILVVGIVTLLLLNSYFTRQEEQYLREQGAGLIQPLENALAFGDGHSELQRIASLGLFSGHVRIRILDERGRVVADSGSFDSLFEPDGSSMLFSPDVMAQLFYERPERLQNFEHRIPGRVPYSQISPPIVTASPRLPITAFSDTRIRLPLRVDDRVVAFAELSEGPALGQVIRDSIRQALLFGGIAALIVASLAALITSRQLSKPLQSLGDAADKMAAGDFRARAPESKLIEFDNLANQFNSMAERLSVTISSLESDRTMLRRLITDASHELRTPLTALKTFNQLLADDANSTEEPTATFIQESGRQLDQLDQITTALLDLSRLEARISGTNFTSGDLRLVIERAIEGFRPILEAKNQSIELELPVDSLVMEHDAEALERAVSNLIINAVNYSEPDSLIKVALTQVGQYASIAVSDQGPGIPDSEQAKVFERFYRGKNHLGQGSGLGLSIAREIAEIHNGTIKLDSQVGKGSTFTLQLPLADVQHPGV